MKFTKKFALVAVMTLGIAGLTGCSENEPVVNNPTYDGTSVKSSFAINIPYGQGTRMSGDNTQANSNFLGMDNIKMFPLSAPAAAGTTLTKMIPLPGIEAAGFNQTKIYSDVQIDVNTANMLFYGQAPVAADAQKFQLGYLTNNLTDASVNTTDAIKFSLNTVTTSGNFTAAGAPVVAQLNAIAGATGWSTATDEVLKTLYASFISNKAGSANSVKTLVADLKDKVTPLNTGATATIAQAILDKIAAAETALAAVTFPQDVNLPDGAAQVAWADGAFSLTETVVMGANTIDYKTVCYPASLYYTANTSLYVTDAVDPTFPAFANWADAGFAGWTNSAVTAATRAIALKEHIQYAVASLKTTVKTSAQRLIDSKDNYIDIPTDGLELTGVIIGGQPDYVGWDFQNLTGERKNSIFDNDVNGVFAKYNATSEPNYTLVLEDLIAAAVTDKAQADKVNVALEFKNTTGVTFYGVDGIIPAGATFYLVGQLNINAAEGVSGVADRNSVFSQDYTTLATFTISSLKNAYNVIPDLRASKMQFGLAVDLAWKAGVSFDVTIE